MAIKVITGARSTTNVQQVRRKDDFGKKSKSSKTSKRGKVRSKARR